MQTSLQHLNKMANPQFTGNMPQASFASPCSIVPPLSTNTSRQSMWTTAPTVPAIGKVATRQQKTSSSVQSSRVTSLATPATALMPAATKAATRPLPPIKPRTITSGRILENGHTCANAVVTLQQHIRNYKHTSVLYMKERSRINVAFVTSPARIRVT